MSRPYPRADVGCSPGEVSIRRLPSAGAEFVGRRRELAEGKRLLAAARLLTLTGSPGVGKTRLAIELARHPLAPSPRHRQVLPDHTPAEAGFVGAGKGEVWFAELASLRGARAPARALALAAGLAERRAPVELAEGLSGRVGLVVLDNCEHLLEPCAALIGALLTGCPDLRVLTTSREPLGVPGEVVWQVPALYLPDPESRPGPKRLRSSDAVTFFSRSAARRLPGSRSAIASWPPLPGSAGASTPTRWPWSWRPAASPT